VTAAIGLKIPHGCQQPLIVLLASHQDTSFSFFQSNIRKKVTSAGNFAITVFSLAPHVSETL